MKSFDVVVIGAGPGGYVAAIRAAQLGLKTAIIEKKHLGGVCLNWGCIPTKALLRSAEIKHYMDHAKDFGLSAKDVSFDMDAIIKRSRDIAGKLSGGIQHLLKKNKVETFLNEGRFKDGKTLDLYKDGNVTETITAKHFIIATGARARQIPNVLQADGDRIWIASDAMTPKFTPKSLLVIGSGAIGVEFASFYNAFDTKVDIVEMQDRILPAEDKEISQMAKKSFEKKGMSIYTKSGVKKLTNTGKAVEAEIEINGKVEKRSYDAAILAIGIIGNTDNLGLEKTKVKVDRNQIETNEWCETAEKGIYAIGDVAGAPWLAHKASHEGIVCVEKIADVKHVKPVNANNIPGCTYSMPQIASLGLTEDQAKEKGHKIKVGKFPFMGNGKALAMGEPEGMIKTLYDEETGELLGAHMIGAEVTELIQGYGVAKTLETTEEEIMHTIFPHPTLSEMMHESTLDAFKKAIHI